MLLGTPQKERDAFIENVVGVYKVIGSPGFDRDELRQIVEFIRGGGLTVSREREKREVERMGEYLQDHSPFRKDLERESE